MLRTKPQRETDENATWLALTPDRKSIRHRGSFSECQSLWRRSKERLVIRREDAIANAGASS